MHGKRFLPEIIEQMVIAGEGDELEYWWEIAVIIPRAVKFWDRNIQALWKPLLVFRRRGEGDTMPFADRVNAEVTPLPPAGQMHRWGQDVAEWKVLAERLSPQSGVICDPFLGSGTTMMAAGALDPPRRFIGADIDPDCIDTAKGRLP